MDRAGDYPDQVIIPLRSDFAARWSTWYPDAPPVGFLLRDAYPERWLRIHSLPEGNRYPTSGFEYAEVRRRHHAVSVDVLGSGNACALLLLHTCRSDAPVAIGAAIGMPIDSIGRVSQLAPELCVESTGFFDIAMCLYGGGIVWHPARFDQFIMASADDGVYGLVVELETGAVYAPYDGGADLFYPTEAQRDHAAWRVAEWRSWREDGL